MYALAASNGVYSHRGSTVCTRPVLLSHKHYAIPKTKSSSHKKHFPYALEHGLPTANAIQWVLQVQSLGKNGERKYLTGVGGCGRVQELHLRHPTLVGLERHQRRFWIVRSEVRILFVAIVVRMAERRGEYGHATLQEPARHSVTQIRCSCSGVLAAQKKSLVNHQVSQ